jgi:hypothetical protein
MLGIFSQLDIEKEADEIYDLFQSKTFRTPKIAGNPLVFENATAYDDFIKSVKTNFELEEQIIFAFINKTDLINITLLEEISSVSCINGLFDNNFKKMAYDIYSKSLNLTSNTFQEKINGFMIKYSRTDLIKFKSECPNLLFIIQKDCKSIGKDFTKAMNF